MPPRLNEYRVTRPDRYPSRCVHSDREGHYFDAASPEDAARKAAKKFDDQTFDVQLWKVDGSWIGGENPNGSRKITRCTIEVGDHVYGYEITP